MQRGVDDARNVRCCECCALVVIYASMIIAFHVVLSGPLTDVKGMEFLHVN
jgi:hypothetical protein